MQPLPSSVVGRLADSSVIPERLAPVVEAGIMPAEMVPDWEIHARGLYCASPQRQRDEAIRTATFGAAGMIYAARSMGLGTTPMIGRCRSGGPRVRTGRGRSAGHAVVHRAGASGKLAAEATPAGGRCAGSRMIQELQL